MVDVAFSGSLSNRIFVFEHKVFGIEGCYFMRNGSDRTPAFCMKLGAYEVSVRLVRLCREFDIRDGSGDGRMLDSVRMALGFVPRVRPKDNIPSELIDGTASWAIHGRHFAIARGRLENTTLACDENTAPFLKQSAPGHPKYLLKMRTQLSRAATAIAERNGLDGPRQVLAGLDTLARETAYIEALREHASRIPLIEREAKRLSGTYKSDPRSLEKLVRICALIETPLRDLARLFDAADRLTRDPVKAVVELSQHVEMIRNARDKLRIHLRLWDEVFAYWSSGEQYVQDDETVARIRNLYAFLSRNYTPEMVWGDRLISTRRRF